MFPEFSNPHSATLLIASDNQLIHFRKRSSNELCTINRVVFLNYSTCGVQPAECGFQLFRSLIIQPRLEGKRLVG